MERNSRKIVRKLLEDGFVLVSISGSHHKFRKDGKTVIVPHPEKDLPKGTALSIARQAGWIGDKSGVLMMNSYFALVHKDPDSAFGVSFPDIPAVFSAADDEADIIANAIEALRLFAEDETLPPSSSLEEILAHADVRDDLAGGAFLIRIPLIEDDTRVVRANVTFEAGVLKAIDETAARRGLTRSAFLASCARKEIETAS